MQPKKTRKVENVCVIPPFSIVKTKLILVVKEKFFMNEDNKWRLIAMLCNAFRLRGIDIKQGMDDVDVDVVNSPRPQLINKSSSLGHQIFNDI